MYQDRYGYPLTTASEASAASYSEGLDLILSAWTTDFTVGHPDPLPT
jgi:hypothetical protein